MLDSLDHLTTVANRSYARMRDFGVFRGGQVMASVRQSRHRWWMALATAVGTMLATAVASSCEAMAQGRSAAASGIANGHPKALSDDVQVPHKGHSEQSAARTVPGGPTSPVPLGRWRSGSTHRPHRRPQAVPKKVPLYDPNDDTTSNDPDEDDDEPSRFLDDPDDPDVANIARLEERAPCPIPRECAPVVWTGPPSSSLPTLQRLRC
jgi:hypothetical protein